MNIKTRAKVVRAMDTIVRCINYEPIFESWLMGGVADGDINKETTDEDLEWYCEDDHFEHLMTLFLRLMVRANQTGGLYCDRVVSEAESDGDD